MKNRTIKNKMKESTIKNKMKKCTIKNKMKKRNLKIFKGGNILDDKFKISHIKKPSGSGEINYNNINIGKISKAENVDVNSDSDQTRKKNNSIYNRFKRFFNKSTDTKNLNSIAPFNG